MAGHCSWEKDCHGKRLCGGCAGGLCRASGRVSGCTAGPCLAVVLAGPGLPQPVGF